MDSNEWGYETLHLHASAVREDDRLSVQSVDWRVAAISRGSDPQLLVLVLVSTIDREHVQELWVYDSAPMTVHRAKS